MMKKQKRIPETNHRERVFHRREILKATGAALLMAASPLPLLSNLFAAGATKTGKTGRRTTSPDWIAEARVAGLSFSSHRVHLDRLQFKLDRVVREGVTVIEADIRLSGFVSEEDFSARLKHIETINKHIHERDLKVLWSLPALEVITPDGRFREDSFARTHPDWLQTAFDGERKAVFYGQKVPWVGPNEESATLCPNSPYRAWFQERLHQLAETGLDGVWLDAPTFDGIVIEWGCSDTYCRRKFTEQTGMAFPETFDLRNPRFWRWLQWRHETLREFLDVCKKTLASADSEIQMMVSLDTLDHLGATEQGIDGSTLSDMHLVWDVSPLSHQWAMARASHDDWVILFNMYQYCRGATRNRPSWAFSHGHRDEDAQLVMATLLATQNNPFEVRGSEMSASVGSEFREKMFRWTKKHSKQIYRSSALAKVLLLYSPRNRDFLDALSTGGRFLTPQPPRQDRAFEKKEDPLHGLEYMGDYRGLGVLLSRHCVPTDIVPFNLVDLELLKPYPVIVLPTMAILTEAEKEMLLEKVRSGATLIVSGTEIGQWKADGTQRSESLWSKIRGEKKDTRQTVEIGKGRVCFWGGPLGRDYLETHDEKMVTPFFRWLQEAEVHPWLAFKQQPVVIAPYRYRRQIIVHVLNYDGIKSSEVDSRENEPIPLSLKLNIPWDAGQKVKQVSQSEPQWHRPKKLSFTLKDNRLIIPMVVGIHCLLMIDTA